MPALTLAVLVAIACSHTTVAQNTNTPTELDPVAEMEKENSAEALLAKLRGAQRKAQGLMRQLAEAQNSIATSESVFTNTTREIASQQEKLWNLSQISFANRGIMMDVEKVISKEYVGMQATGNELKLLMDQAADNAKKAEDVAHLARQLSSMGDVKCKAGGCLDALDREKQGSDVQMWTCLKGRENQQWALDLKTGRLKNLHGICIAAPTPNVVGSTVMMWGCDPGTPTQRWAYDEGAGSLKTSGGLCLHAPTPTVKGSALQLASCDPSVPGQQWDMIAGSTGLRQQLDDLNTEMWTLQNPANGESMDAQEKDVSELESGVQAFLQQLGKHAQTVLANRLRHRANKVRRAVNRLGDASNDQFLAPEQPEDAPQAFAADLGIGV